LVDVGARQHDDVGGIVGPHVVEVLVAGIGGAAVAGGLVGALVRRQPVAELAQLGLEEGPAALQVAQQAVRLVLRQDADLAQARVHAVGQREIDDAELAAEIDRRLAADVGEVHQAAAAPAGKQQHHRAPWQATLGVVDVHAKGVPLLCRAAGLHPGRLLAGIMRQGPARGASAATCRSPATRPHYAAMAVPGPPGAPMRLREPRVLATVVAAGALLAIAGKLAGIAWLVWLFKPLTTALLCWVAWRRGLGGDRYARLVTAGLVLSLVGDILLIEPSLFVAGLLAFLLAHLAYIAA